jgi:uncharacterized protein (UPF0548 family)
MSLWRFGRGWSQTMLLRYLEEQRSRWINFDALPEQMTKEHGWTVDGDDEPVATEPLGPPLPAGPYLRLKQAIVDYEFSDPSIVVAHFDPRAPLDGRDMLLEIKVWGFRFLNGVRVRQVRDSSDDHRTSFGYRYDTLEGHFEQGFEWFVLSKNHETGEIRFRIEAHWRLGQFPTWWSHLGFLLIGQWYRRAWRHRAVARLRRLAARSRAESSALPRH